MADDVTDAQGREIVELSLATRAGSTAPQGRKGPGKSKKRRHDGGKTLADVKEMGTIARLRNLFVSNVSLARPPREKTVECARRARTRQHPATAESGRGASRRAAAGETNTRRPTGLRQFFSSARRGRGGAAAAPSRRRRRGPGAAATPRRRGAGADPARERFASPPTRSLLRSMSTSRPRRRRRCIRRDDPPSEPEPTFQKNVGPVVRQHHALRRQRREGRAVARGAREGAENLRPVRRE